MTNLKIANALTEHDLAERKNYLTASDIPMIMGTSPWGTSMNVWLDKMGLLEPAKPTPAMLWGSLLEDDVVAFVEARLRDELKDPSIKATRVGIRRKHPNKVMSCTLDSVLAGRNESIESKVHAAEHNNIDWDAWGDEWSDDIPPDHLDQVLAQIACANLNRVYYTPSLGRMSPTLYVVEREKWLPRIARIEQAACDFWDRHIVTGTPPEGVMASLDAAKRARAIIDPSTVVALDDVTVERRDRVNRLINKLVKIKDTLDADIRTALIAADAGRSPKGHMVFMKEVRRSGYEVQPTTYRRMSVRLANALTR